MIDSLTLIISGRGCPRAEDEHAEERVLGTAEEGHLLRGGRQQQFWGRRGPHGPQGGGRHSAEGEIIGNQAILKYAYLLSYFFIYIFKQKVQVLSDSATLRYLSHGCHKI